MKKQLRIIIVEDEPATARSLRASLLASDRGVCVVAMLDSVASSIAWLSDNNAGADLAFMDIRLADGLSFDIFKKVAVSMPVVFVTAYDEYALRAFKSNGIDYILKPFDDDELVAALDKHARISGANIAEGLYRDMQGAIARLSAFTAYKRSFLVHFKDKLIPLAADEIAWFHTAFDVVHAHTGDGRMYAIELTMEQLEQQLDPGVFFRASRQFLLHRNCIREIESHFNGRLAVRVHPGPQEAVIISKARAPIFKSWMNS